MTRCRSIGRGQFNKRRANREGRRDQGHTSTIDRSACRSVGRPGIAYSIQRTPPLCPGHLSIYSNPTAKFSTTLVPFSRRVCSRRRRCCDKLPTPTSAGSLIDRAKLNDKAYSIPKPIRACCKYVRSLLYYNGVSVPIEAYTLGRNGTYLTHACSHKFLSLVASQYTGAI